MINFRFHLVSLIAVFLALAVGVVVGYAVLGSPTVDTLQRRVDTVERRANEIRAENDALREEIAQTAEAFAVIDRFAAGDRLAATTVLPIAARGLDEDRVAETVALARESSGQVPGVLWIEERWNLPTADDVSELAGIVGTTSTNRATVRDAGLKALADRLAQGAPAAGRTDVLAELAGAGFVTAAAIDDVPFTAASLTARVSWAWVAGASDADVDWTRVLGPLTRDLAGAGLVVVASDAWTATPDGVARGEDLAVVRRDPVLGDRVSTVDDFDRVQGPLAVVLAVAARSRGVVGHYGTGSGATAVLPEWWIG